MTVLQFVVSMSFKNYTAHATANCLYHSILMHEMILELIKYDRLRKSATDLSREVHSSSPNLRKEKRYDAAVEGL